MENIEILRNRIEQIAENSLEIETTVDVAMSWLDEIEREVAESYMKLPVDADGVPIHVYDEMTDRDNIPYIVMSVSTARVYCKDGSWVYPSDCHHVKSDPVKELLEKLVRDVYGSYYLTAEQGKWIDECAERIREAVVA